MRSKQTRGQLDYLIPVAHPNLHRLGKIGEQLCRSALAAFDLDGGATKFSCLTPLHNSAQGASHPLHSVTDSKHRNPQLEQF